MKRLLLIVTLVLALAACSSKPKYMNAKTYEYGLEAVSWCQRYDDGKITVDELADKIDEISDEMSKLELEGLESAENSNIIMKLGTLKLKAKIGNAGFLEEFDELKELLK